MICHGVHGKVCEEEATDNTVFCHECNREYIAACNAAASAARKNRTPANRPAFLTVINTQGEEG